jgi:hypothetical protein
MSRKTPKTLAGHGIALLLKDRNVATVDGIPTLTDWRKGRYALAMGTIETFNGVTGAFTATLTVGVPGNQEGNTFAVTGSLEALTGAPLEPGTRATHTSGTHTLTGETEIPAYACYIGSPVFTDADPAWHEILPGDIVFTPGGKNPLTASYVFNAGVIATQPNGEPYLLLDGGISANILEVVSDVKSSFWTKHGHTGSWGDVVACDAPTGEALAQFAKALLPSYPIRTLSYGLDALELVNIPSICHGGFASTTILEAELPHVSTKQIQITALATLTEMTLKAAVEAERELVVIREWLEALHRSLRESELYNAEVAQELVDNVK